MNELEVQTKIRRAVEDAGGAAHKLSTPFKVGISDLLVKLTNCPAALLEVKLAKYGKAVRPDHLVKLDVTHNQDKFLERFAAAGMTCGVVSSLQIGRKLLLCCLELDAIRAVSYTVPVSAHVFAAFPTDIATMLYRFCHARGGR